MFVSIYRCAVLPLDGWFARDGVGVLTCIPLNRFHATSQYQWLWNDYEMEDIIPLRTLIAVLRSKRSSVELPLRAGLIHAG